MPTWLRLVIAADKVLWRVAKYLRDLLPAAVSMLVPVERRDQVNAWIYAAKPEYWFDSDWFRHGLWEWEVDFLSLAGIPAGGSLLIGGVGGGREAFFFGQMGYDVLAFEPSSLVAEAAKAARGLPNVEVCQASYADVVSACAGTPGPLDVLKTRQFDGVILGWDSLSHIVAPPGPDELLSCLRTLQPRATVLCSFYGGTARGGQTSGRTPRQLVRWFFDPPVNFNHAIGFYRPFDEAGIQRLATSNGYRVLKGDFVIANYAVLQPQP